MKASSHPDGLTIRDAPGCFRALGVFFCALGALALAAAAASAGQDYPTWLILFAAVLGLAAVGAGIYLISNAPATRVVVRTGQNTISIYRHGLLRRKAWRFALAEVRGARIEQGADIDGGPVYSLRLELLDGREIPLTRLWLHNRAELENALAELNRCLHPDRADQVQDPGGRK
jgi:hypothetical protein